MGAKTKHNGKIIYDPDKNRKMMLNEKQINGLERVLITYADSKINKNLSKSNYGHHGYQEYQERWDAFCKGKDEYFPVYYSKLGKDVIYLSPACITKEAYKNQLSDILKAQGEFQSCTDIKKLCPACSLFGMVGAKSAKASSLRFADARVAEKRDAKAYYDEIITLEELASPKATAAEFYLQKENGASFWTYDYYVKDGKLVIYMPKIAGRKFYWHHIDVKLPKGVVKTERNKTVRPLKSEVPFTEDIYFDGITETQLEQLLYICNISSEDTAGYKLGAGKPLGLGSISMKVEEVKIRTIHVEDGTICYKEDSYEELWKKQIMKELVFRKKCDSLLS